MNDASADKDGHLPLTCILLYFHHHPSSGSLSYACYLHSAQHLIICTGCFSQVLQSTFLGIGGKLLTSSPGNDKCNAAHNAGSNGILLDPVPTRGVDTNLVCVDLVANLQAGVLDTPSPGHRASGSSRHLESRSRLDSRRNCRRSIRAISYRTGSRIRHYRGTFLLHVSLANQQRKLRGRLTSCGCTHRLAPPGFCTGNTSATRLS